MQMHVRLANMRTTVEISKEHRAELLRLAGERGLKGFSSIIREALDFYLQKSRTTKTSNPVLKLKGILNEKEAKVLETHSKEIRNNWR